MCALSALPDIREFLKACAARNGWGEAMLNRLDAVSEETLLLLLREAGDGRTGGGRSRRLRLSLSRGEGGAKLEFVAAAGGDSNIQERLALLGDVNDEGRLERDVSIRLLRHLASSVRHQQYHDADIVTVRVRESEAESG